MTNTGRPDALCSELGNIGIERQLAHEGAEEKMETSS